MKGVRVFVADEGAVVRALLAGRSTERVAAECGTTVAAVRRIRKEHAIPDLASGRKTKPRQRHAQATALWNALAPKLDAINAIDSLAERRAAQLRLYAEMRTQRREA